MSLGTKPPVRLGTAFAVDGLPLYLAMATLLRGGDCRSCTNCSRDAFQRTSIRIPSPTGTKAAACGRNPSMSARGVPRSSGSSALPRSTCTS